MTDIESINESLLNWVRSRIIEWFDANGRHFSWRETDNPYRILIAEMLLRRTTAKAVSRVFDEFVSRFESVSDLANADTNEIASMIRGLGLQNMRARHLSKAAKIITDEFGGLVPRELEKLRSLPGLGRYGASAVQNFGFGLPVPMVDGNILHFFNRFFGVELSGPDDEKAWALARRLGGESHDRRLYWGIIDLVSLVCLHRRPRCESCPVQERCLSYHRFQV